MSSVVDALCDAMDRSPVLNDASFSMPIGSLEASVIAAAGGSYGYQQGDHGGHGYRHVEPPMTVYNYGPPMVDGPGMMAYYAPPFDAGNYGYPPLVDAYRRLEPPPNMVYNSNYGPIVEAGMDNSNASSPSTSTNRRSSPPKKNSKNAEIDREVVEGNRYTAQSLKISLSEGGEKVDGYGEEDKSLIPMNPMAAAAAKLSSKLDINFFATDDSTAAAAEEESTTAAATSTTTTTTAATSTTTTTAVAAVNELGGEEESSAKHAKSRRTGGRFKRNRDTPTQPVSHATQLTPKINIASDNIAAIPSSQPIAHVEAQQTSPDSAATLAPTLVQAPHAQSTVPASSSSSQSSVAAVPAIMGVEAALRYLSQPQQLVSTATTIADGPYDRSGVDTPETANLIYAAGGIDQEKSKPSRGTKKTKRNTGKAIKDPATSPADPQADVSEPIIIAASKVVDAPAVAVVVDEYTPRPGSIDGSVAADANEAVSVGFSTRRPRKRSSNKGQGREARAASSNSSEATPAPTHQSHPPLSSSSSSSLAKPTPDQQVLQGRNDYPEGKSKGTNASSAWNSSSVGRTPSQHHHQPEPIVSKSIGAVSVDAASKQYVEQQSHHSGDSSTQPPNYREGSSNLSSELSHSTSQPPSRGQYSQSSSSHRQGQLNHHTQSNNQPFNGQGPPNQSVNNKVGPAQPSTIQGATNQSANNQGPSSHFINNQVANGRYPNSRGPSTQAVASQGSYSHDSYNRVVRVNQPGPANQPPSINARVPANQPSANHFTPPSQPTTHQSTSSSQPSINSRGPANQPPASSKVVPASYQSSNGNSGPSPQPVGSNGVVARNGNTQQQAGYTRGSQHTGYKDPQHAGNRSSNAPAVKQN